MAKASRASFGEAVARLGEKNQNIVVMDADLAKSTQTAVFMKKFPERHYEFGIAESNMIGSAAGMALCGKVPFVASFAAFLITRLETIRVAVAYNKTNVKLVGTHVGLGIGPDGTSQMGLEDIGAMRSLPNVVVIQPSDDVEAQQAVAWAAAHDGPVYLRLTRQKLEDVHDADYSFKFGVADTVYAPETPGKLQATIFTSGGTLAGAIAAAKDLGRRGFAVKVVNCATIHPFDAKAVRKAAEESQRLVTVEDHNVTGGIGSAVAECLAESGKGVPLVRVGVQDFGESAEGDELYEKYGIAAGHIAEACLRNLS